MRFFLLSILFIYLQTAGAQETTHKEQYWGVRVGIPIINELLPEGRKYQPFNLLGNYTITNLTKKRKNNLWVYVEPQLVWVTFDNSDPQEYEFGANMGLRYEWNLGKKFLWTAALGAGPHYITVETESQYQGFIFSDNFETGFRFFFKNTDWQLDVAVRFRHISNANLYKPNIGIDNWFLVIGIGKRL